MTKTKYKNKKSGTGFNKLRGSLVKSKFSHPYMILVLAIITLLTVANIQTTQNYTASAQNVLGESIQNEEQKQVEEQQSEVEKKLEEAQKESVKQAAEQQKEAEKTTDANSADESPKEPVDSKTETISPSILKMKKESKGEKQETEIETTAGQKIKTKIEDDGTTKIEVENGVVKLKYSIVGGQVIINEENEDNVEVEIEDEGLEDLENLEDELEEDDIKLVPTATNQRALTRNKIAAITDFPLSINAETKELIITTPTGQRVITVLPDEAVQSLLAAGIINSIETPPTDITAQDQLGALTGVVEIEVRDNETVYKVKGKKTHRILGIIPVTTPVTAFVSIETGLTVAKQQSVLTNIIDFLSP